MSLEDIINAANKGHTIKYLRPRDLEDALLEMERLGYYVHTLEASELRSDSEVPDIGLSLVGCDGDENWENHYDAKRNMLLVQEKIKLAKESGLNIVYEAWVGKLA